MAKKLLGKEVNQKLEEMIREKLKGKEGTPTLVTFRVGDDAPSIAYAKSMTKRMDKMGVKVEHRVLPAEATQDALISEVKAAGDDPAVHGIFLFLPLAEGFDEAVITEAIPPKKDVDGVRRDQLGKLMNYEDGFINCALGALLAFLDHYEISVFGKRVVILGAGRLIGRPLSMLLLKRKATVTLTNTKTPNVEEIAQSADILIGAMGRAQKITREYLRKGQIVLDAGTDVVDGKTVGDLKIDEAEEILSAYTPTPGGIGTVTTTILALHTVEAYCRDME